MASFNEEEKPAQEQLPFNGDRQDAVLGHLLTKEPFFLQCKDKIQPRWFNKPMCQKIWATLQKYYLEFHHFPSRQDVFEHADIQSEEMKRKNDINLQISTCIANSGIYSFEHIVAELTDWLHARTYMDGVYESRDLYNRGHLQEAYVRLGKVVQEIHETTFNNEKVWDFSDPEAIIRKSHENVGNALTWGLTSFNKLLLPEGKGNGCLLPGTSTTIVAPVNVGKCLAKGTELLNFLGQTVRVEDVRAGDMLMGPDGEPRKVLSITKGFGPLYKISPKTGGKPWVCNDAHVLSLKCGFDDEPENRERPRHKRSSENGEPYLWKGDIVNIPLDEYLEKPSWWKSRMKLWRASLDFSHKEVSVDPYILGLWLGDGSSNRADFTSMDIELANPWMRWIEECGDIVRIWRQPNNKASIYHAAPISRCGPRSSIKSKCNKLLHNTGVLNNKHIPYDYLTGSRNQRLQLLAGLLDTDGFYFGDQSPGYEISQKNKVLAEDIAYLARSLGFKVSVTEVEKGCQTGVVGIYQRLTIFGKLSEIPVRLSRKRAIDSIKDPSSSGFRVEAVGEGEYFGFCLDGDHLFLLGDFTVTHNTTIMITVACANIAQGKKVLWIPHEGSPNELQKKFLCCMLDRDLPWLEANLPFLSQKDLDERQVRIAQYIQRFQHLLNENLTFMPMIRQGQTVEAVASAVRRKQQELEMVLGKGRGYDLVVDDYPAKLTTEEAKGGKLEHRHKMEVVYMAFNRLAEELGFHMLNAAQTNREGSKINKGMRGYEKRLLEIEDFAEAFGPMADTATVITANRDPLAEAQNRLSLHCAKSRTSAKGWTVVCRTAYNRGISHSEILGCTWYNGSATGSERMDQLLDLYRGQQIPSNVAM